MKFRLGLVCATLVSGGIAGAQPTPTPAAPAQPQPPQQPQPAPQPPPPDQEPSWLPGVQDVTAQEIATPGKLTISMARAVELAERQHPDVRLARASAAQALGRVAQAKVLEHPTLSLSGGASIGSKSNRPCSITDPTMTCGGFFTSSEGFQVEASASWRIYDFGLTRANVNAADASAEAAAAGVDTSVLDIRQNVELAYLEAIARARLVVVAQATVKSEEAHVDQAKRFVAAGAHDPIEVAQAEARLANARSALAQAQSNEATALATLRAAIGWIDPTRSPQVDQTWPTPANEEPATLPDLVATARQHRPEIIQLDREIEASQDSLVAAHAERRPVLAANASSLWTPGSGNWSPQPSWTAGLSLSWLAWDGGKSRADVEVATAGVQASVAQRDELLVTLTSALEQARALIVSNRANVEASTEAVTSAQAELKLAEARYAQGLGSQIELADAQTAVTTAEGNLVTAQWQLADAWVQLRRATGEI